MFPFNAFLYGSPIYIDAFRTDDQGSWHKKMIVYRKVIDMDIKRHMGLSSTSIRVIWLSLVECLHNEITWKWAKLWTIIILRYAFKQIKTAYVSFPCKHIPVERVLASIYINVSDFHIVSYTCSKGLFFSHSFYVFKWHIL